MRILAAVLLLVLLLPVSARAQDIRGMEVCTAEKQMERRTGCLQANDQFLHQALAKQKRETDDKLAATGRELTAAKAEIAALKAALAKLRDDMAQMQAKTAPATKK